MNADDRLAATLAGIRERGYRNGATGAACARLSDAAAVDIPLLLAALDAVLKAHRPNTADGRCSWCRDPDGQRSAFPCGEYLTIRAALAGKEAGDAG